MTTGCAQRPMQASHRLTDTVEPIIQPVELSNACDEITSRPWRGRHPFTATLHAIWHVRASLRSVYSVFHRPIGNRRRCWVHGHENPTARSETRLGLRAYPNDHMTSKLTDAMTFISSTRALASTTRSPRYQNAAASPRIMPLQSSQVHRRG